MALVAFLAGVICAYLYVFFLHAPGLAAVFLGAGNLPLDLRTSRQIDPGLLASIFLLYMLPHAVAVLAPVWRAAVTEPVEAMK